MGSRATPSKSCEPCRVKRRRCDLKVPACSQCRRAGIECPGYKDAFTLRLRDETTLTVRKLESKKTPRGLRDIKNFSLAPPCDSTINTVAAGPVFEITPLSQENGIHSDHNNDEHHRYGAENQQMVPTKTLGVLPDQAAISYFMHTYAANSSFFYLPAHYNMLKRSTQDTAFGRKLDIDEVVTVPALVLLSHELRQPSLLAFAQSRYATVLAATQEALADPQQAVADITLTSVLLLGLVEALQFRGRRDPSGWDAHAYGAATLLKMRGTQQLETSLGRQLCLHASVNIRRRCAMLASRMPAPLRTLLELIKEQEEMSPSLNASDLVFLRVSMILEDFIVLRADVRSASLSAAEFLQRSLAISDELADIRSAFEVAEPYGTVESSSVSLATTPYGDFIRTYSSPRMAKRWVDIHLLRLYLAEHVREAIQACDSPASPNTSLSPSANVDEHFLFSNTDTYWTQACQTGTDASLEILSSVPYILHMSKTSKFMTSTLLLPLSSVAVSEMLPTAMGSFARDTLRYIGECLDVPQAIESFQMVQSSPGLEMWSMITHAL